jgi:glycosyltransferase involved in cell wall biosynthesis
LEYYSTFSAATPPEGEFRVLFQGSIGPNHGIEEIIGFMQQSISGKQIKLVLKGFCTEEYKRDLLSLATSLGVHHFIEFHGVSCYSEVPLLMSKCHVGIAIHKGTDLMNSTLGTSSNKIYEYAAMGLPVILFDNTHFKAHLGKWDWCFFVDKECSSILQIFEQIILNYPALQNSAIKAHRAGLNFEHYVRDLKFTL